MQLEKNGEKPIIPADIRRRISERLKNRKQDLIHQIALMESGLSAYTDEIEFCETYGITEKEFAQLKESKRNDIERLKDEHREGKFMLVRLLGRRERYMMMLEDAILKDDVIQANKMKEILKTMNELAPISQLQDIAQTLKMVNDGPSETDPSKAINIQINNHPATKEADEIFAREKFAPKTVDVKND